MRDGIVPSAALAARANASGSNLAMTSAIAEPASSSSFASQARAIAINRVRSPTLN